MVPAATRSPVWDTLGLEQLSAGIYDGWKGGMQDEFSED